MFLYMLFKHDKCHFQIFHEISSIKGHLFLRTFNDQIDFVKAECKSGLMNVLKWYRTYFVGLTSCNHFTYQLRALQNH